MGFVDSDDLIDVKMYEQLVSAFNHDVQLSACNVKFLYSRKNKLSCKQTDNLIIYSKDDMYKEILNNKNLSGYAANKLYKKEIINLMKKNELFNENIYICEDILFNCNYLKYCTNIAYINNQYYMYYINSSGAYNQKFNNKWLTSIDAYDEMLDIYKNHSEQNLIYAYCNYIEANFEILKKIKLAELKDKKLKKIYKNNINKYFKCVLFSKKISLKKKIKIILYKIDPTLIYKIKNVLKK